MIIQPGRRNGFWGLDPYTKLYLPFNGADGAAATEDLSRSAHAVTFNGNAALDTAQKVFGASSLLLDSNSSVSVEDHDDWNFGTGNFTVDCWLMWSALPGNTLSQYIGSHYESANYYYDFFLSNSSGTYYLMMALKNGTVKGSYSLTVTPSLNTWYHVAFVRNGATGLIFFNGDSTGTIETVAFGANDVGNISGAFHVGNAAGLIAGHNGWIDEFMVSKGIARKTANFTPQPIAYR